MEKAEKIILGGNGLLSKRPKRFLSIGWPTIIHILDLIKYNKRGLLLSK